MANIFEGTLTLNDNWGEIVREGVTYQASGEQVQELVRSELLKRMGHFYCVSVDNLKNALLGFLDEATFNAWQSDWAGKEAEDGALNDPRILCKTTVTKGIPDPYYDIRLESKYKSDKYISIDGSVIFPIRSTFTYNAYDEGTGKLVSTDVRSNITLLIEGRTSSSTDWAQAEVRRTIVLEPQSITKEGDVFELELSNILLRDADWEVRMSVSGTNPNDGSTIKSQDVYMNIIKTRISANLTNKWYEPFKLTTNGSTRPLNLQFDYEGQFVQKYLNIEITGAGDEKGTNPLKRNNIKLDGDNRTGYTYTVQKAISDTYNIYAHGIHTITYWIEIDQNKDYSTPKKSMQIMVVGDDKDTTPYILFNEVEGLSADDPLVNWTKEKLFDYAVYAVDERGNNRTNFPVNMSFKDANGVERLTNIAYIETNKSYSLERDLAIDTEPGLSALWLSFDSDGEPIKSAASMMFYINNAGDYTPSEGAIFTFNPRTRSNQEADSELQKVYNTANGKVEEIPNAIWNGVKFNNTDGWINDPKYGSCLRLLDKQTLTIPYQPLKLEDGSNFLNTTIEVTFAVRNIIDNEVSLMSIAETHEDVSEDNQGNEVRETIVNGFELRGNDAYFLPNVARSREILDTHDVMFAEGEKIHMVVCINKEANSGSKVVGNIPDNPGETPYTVTLNKDANFIRIYINGVINRVVEFSSVNWDDDSLTRYIKLGNFTDKNAADIDIYEIKVFQSNTPKKNYEILKDYISSLSTTTEKDRVIAKNSILTPDKNNPDQPQIREGQISYEECCKQYNTLLWMPGEYSTDGFVRPNGREFGQTDKKKGNNYRLGNLKVNYFKPNTFDADGNPVKDTDRSGTLYHMSSEGQGTTAMLYFKWNQRYRFDGIADPNNEDELIATSYFESESGKVIEEGYDLFEADPVIGRLDGKVNWASSMQSHKMGTVALYHDCWKRVVGSNGITRLTNAAAFDEVDLDKTGAKYTTSEDAFKQAQKFTGRANGYGSCRVTVHQEPFMLFVQPTVNDSPIFYSMMTWGASKGDKPTFGYDKNFNKYFVMIEGTDNFRDLISCNIPWDDYHFVQYFDDDAVDEGIKYPVGGKMAEQFEISMGKDSEEYIGATWNGKNPCLKMFRDMINFIYLHNPNIVMFNGSYDELVEQMTPGKFNTYDFYWVNKASSSDPTMSKIGSGSARFDVYRWNQNDIDMGGQGAWVPAGFYREEDGVKYYESLNLLKQFGYAPNSSEIGGLQTGELNQFFKNKRASHFKSGYNAYATHDYGYNTSYPNGISDFMHVDDLLFTMQFLKLIAGTDNWSKNTYIYNTGIYYKQQADGSYGRGSALYGGLDKFGFFQDDLDTIFEIDNYGAKTKPYYVEEHDYVTTATGDKDPYWNSEYNGMYVITELAYADDLKTTMRNILGAMADLGSGDPVVCLDKYYQDKSQNYYPETIFNAAAEQFYIDGYYRGSSRASDRYAMFLSQCLGGQHSAEKQWQKNRIDYLSSYAQYGIWSSGTTGKGLAFIPSETIELELTPHIWMYPAATEGSSSITYTGSFEESFNVPGRVPAGKTFKLRIVSAAGSENAVSLKGQDFYRDFGNMARVKTPQNQFNISGERLSKLTVVGTDENKGIIFDAYQGFTSSGDAKVDNIRDITISGKTANNSRIFNMESSDLSALWRLTNLDLSATSIKSVVLAPGSNLTNLKLPAATQKLVLESQESLSNLSLASYKNLNTVTITNPSEYMKNETIEVIKNCNNSGAVLTNLTLLGIDWKDVDLDMIRYILSVKNLSLTGYIKIKPTEVVDYDIKYQLLKKFGNVDSSDNDLFIEYTQQATTANNRDNKILGDTYIYRNGKYPYKVRLGGNKFIDIKWSISENSFGTIDSEGVLTFTDVADSQDERKATITCTVYVSDGGSFTIEKEVYFREKTAQIGDYIYFDGSISSPEDYNPDKTVVGICYYVNGSDRRMMSIEYKSTSWGLSEATHPGIGEESKYRINPLPVGDVSTTSNASNLDLAKISTQTLDKDLTTQAYSKSGIAAGLKQFPAGSVIPCGQFNSINIIEHRNENVLNYGIGAGVIPGMNSSGQYVYDELTHMEEIITSDFTANQINIASLYPATSYCYVFVPTVKAGEALNDKFVKHNWYLPSLAELMYMWSCIKNGYCKTLETAGIWSESATWGDYSGPSYWSSNQYDKSSTYYGTFRKTDFRKERVDSSSTINIRACARF